MSNTLMDLIFKDVTNESAETTVELVHSTIKQEAKDYKITLEILDNHKLQDAEVYAEVRTHLSILEGLVNDINQEVANESLTYAIETVQLNTIDSIL